MVYGNEACKRQSKNGFECIMALGGRFNWRGSPTMGAMATSTKIKLLGKIVSLKVMEPRVCSLWKLEMGCEIIDMENRYFSVRVFSRQDYLKVLEGRPWIVLEHYLIVAKWWWNFRPYEESISSTSVWVRLPGFPLKLFYENRLLKVAGKLVRVWRWIKRQSATTRGKFVRYVWLLISKNLSPHVQILGHL